MTKKILILVNKTSANVSRFHDQLVERMGNQVEVHIGYFEDVIIDIEEEKTSILIGKSDIRNYDLTYFRRAGKEFLWLVATIALYLDKFGKAYFDTTYQEVGPTGTKLNSFIKLALRGMPVIPSIFCYRENIMAKTDFILKKLGLPVVVKDLYSQRGIGVFLAKEKSDIQKILVDNPGRKLMFQKFIDKKDEYRVLVLRDKIGSFEKKTASDPNEFRNNVALGATEQFINVAEIPQKLKSISMIAAKILKIEIAGVDIVTDTKGHTWLIEVNRGPGFTYDSKDSPEMDSVSKFFLKELKK